MDKVFKVLNYLIMVVAGALLLYMIYLVIAAAIATKDPMLLQAKTAFIAKALCLAPQKTLAFLDAHDLGELTTAAVKLALGNPACSKGTKQKLEALLGALVL